MAVNPCQPAWQTDPGTECPYGSASLLQVTVPNTRSFFDLFALLYAVAPLLMLLFVLERAIVRRMRRFASLIVLFAFMALIAVELKTVFKQPRPARSCLTSCGLPSGPLTLVAAFLVVVAYDTISAPDTGEALHWRMLPIIVAVIVLAPYGLCQWILNDNTFLQVFASYVIGAGFGTFWVLLLRDAVEYVMSFWCWSAESPRRLPRDSEAEAEIGLELATRPSEGKSSVSGPLQTTASSQDRRRSVSEKGFVSPYGPSGKQRSDSEDEADASPAEAAGLGDFAEVRGARPVSGSQLADSESGKEPLAAAP